MKTYKIVFSCQSALNQIPDSQTLFGAICNIIKYTKGESALNEYIASLQSEHPIFVHSSMFLNGFFPMVKKNIFPLDVINRVVTTSAGNEKIVQLEQMKKFKKIAYVSESIFKTYLMKDDFGNLSHDVLNHHDRFKVENGVLCEAKESAIPKYESILLTRNGLPEKDSTDKTLFYSPQLYYEKGTEFCIYIKTEKNPEYLHDLFSYLEFFGVGVRRTVGLNVFRLERIEEFNLKSDNKRKLMLSKYIPNEEVCYESSYYQLDSQIYRASKDYAANGIVGKFTHILEGSYMMMKENKDFYGKVIKTVVNDKPLYHYAIGFVL